MATTNGGPALQKEEVEKEANHIVNCADKDVSVNNWSQPGPAAFDFRSMPTTQWAIDLSTVSDGFVQAM